MLFKKQSVISTSSRLEKIHSRIPNDGGSENKLPTGQESSQALKEPNMLDVTVTILSLTGFRAATNEDELSLAKGLIQADSNNNMNMTARLVASFEKGANAEASDEVVPMIHKPSVPFHLPSQLSHEGIYDDIVSWPEQTKEFTDVSSFQFQRVYAPEDGTNRLEPLVCPIHISVSRNRNMYKLGVASVIVNGAEKGESSITVPITIDEKISNAFEQQLDEHVKPMMSLKGDTMKCRLDRNSSLRVLVKVKTCEPIPHSRMKEPFFGASSKTNDPNDPELEEDDDGFVFDSDMIPNVIIQRGRSRDTLRSDLTNYSSVISSTPTPVSRQYSIDEGEDDCSLYSTDNSRIAKLKQELRFDDWLLGPKNVDDSELLSLEDTTVSSSSSFTTGSSISEIVSSVKISYSNSSAKRWVDRFACGTVPLCGCRESNKDLLLAAVDENSIVAEPYSLKRRI